MSNTFHKYVTTGVGTNYKYVWLHEQVMPLLLRLQCHGFRFFDRCNRDLLVTPLCTNFNRNSLFDTSNATHPEWQECAHPDLASGLCEGNWSPEAIFMTYVPQVNRYALMVDVWVVVAALIAFIHFVSFRVCLSSFVMMS